MPKLSCRLRGTDAEDRLTQGGGDGLGEEDGVGDEGEAEEPPGLLFQADVDSGAESEDEDEEEEHYEVVEGEVDRGAGNEEVDDGGRGEQLDDGQEENIEVREIVVEGHGRQRGGGRAEAAFDERPSQAKARAPKKFLSHRFLTLLPSPLSKKLTTPTFLPISGPLKVCDLSLHAP